MNRYRTFLIFILIPFNSTLYASQWVITKDGHGPISEGMSLEQIEKLLDKKLYNHNPYPNASKDECSYYSTSSENKALTRYMIENQKLIRVEISGKNIRTSKGTKIGDTQASLKDVYGANLEWETDRYDDLPVAYLWKNKSIYKGIKFKIDYKGKIDSIMVGRALLLSEGCN